MATIDDRDGGVEPGPGARSLATSAWCVVAAFGAYFCMYAFRKPFTAATYDGVTAWGIGYKSALITAQMLGYTASKFLGIKFVAEVEPRRRVAFLLALVALAEGALILFGLTPPPYNLLWLFCNGLPLGMVFGLVLGFLEGRRQTEALAAGLCASFIVAGGVTKSAGSWLLEMGVARYWMPAATGLLFAPALLAFAWMLTRIPRPSNEDVEARSARSPMDGADRRTFFRRHAVVISLLVSAYLLINVLRGIRDDFAPEIWKGLREAVPSGIFAWSEMLVGAGVMLLSGLAVLISDNRRAFFFGLLLSLGGVGLVVASLVGQRSGALAPFPFMVLIGIGLYLPYIAIHTTLFERLIALTRDRGNVGYLMSLADSFGYLGYVALLLGSNAVSGPGAWLRFFLGTAWTVALACALLFAACWAYFATKPAMRRRAEAVDEASVLVEGAG